jgi:hypothetical protein
VRATDVEHEHGVAAGACRQWWLSAGSGDCEQAVVTVSRQWRMCEGHGIQGVAFASLGRACITRHGPQPEM